MGLTEMYGLGIAKGMILTLKHLGRKPFTTQYPEERLSLPARFRGYEFTWYINRCTGCATCAKACPHGCIRIVTAGYADNRYIVDTFDIETSTCMYCGLCVEACPFQAIYMGSGFERATYNVERLTLDKEDLIAAPKKPSLYAQFTLPKPREDDEPSLAEAVARGR
ncbi:MAG: NADH-quinone oxidoreductase subunit I [Chloroflexi bacterium]|nr:NADH-quinone oxidoreductase subunit I [Chloroflexota bacterium]